MLKLKNTLTGNVEEFKPLNEKEIGMYNCGPTVYNYAHIGNLRAYVFSDTLRRTLEYLYPESKIKQVVNVTDIGHLSDDGDEGEDKMTKALKREGKPMTLEAMRELADFYFLKFKEDLKLLNIETPEHFPFASDHISDEISLINKLIEKKYTYNTSDGIYLDTSRIKEYGKLGLSSSGESRITVNPEKKNPRDFALWKFDEKLGYIAPFGKGFPGWHIECSAMSMKYLGETFDIHTGGIDHIPIHHNNEIAQSESVTGKPLARFWLHNAFVNISNDKMAKSGEDFIRLQSLVDRGIHPLAYRFWLLQANYDSPVSFTFESLMSAQSGLENLTNKFRELGEKNGKVVTEYNKKFISAIENNLNTAEGLALVWKLLDDKKISPEDKRVTILDFDKVLGLNFDKLAQDLKREISFNELPEEIQNLIKEREEVRKNKNWEKADLIRNELEKRGYIIDDTPEGPKISMVSRS